MIKRGRVALFSVQTHLQSRPETRQLPLEQKLYLTPVAVNLGAFRRLLVIVVGTLLPCFVSLGKLLYAQRQRKVLDAVFVSPKGKTWPWSNSPAARCLDHSGEGESLKVWEGSIRLSLLPPPSPSTSTMSGRPHSSALSQRDAKR